LTQLLDGALFEPTAWSRALYAPPWNWSTGKKTADVWEQTGESFWPGLGAIVLAEAVKRTAALSPRSQGVLKRKNTLEAQPVPALSPHQQATNLSK
jgi:hypothetical protein